MDQRPSSNLGPMLHCRVSATQATSPSRDPLSPIALKYQTWVTDHDTASLTSKWYVFQIHRFTHAACDSVLTKGYTFLPPYRGLYCFAAVTALLTDEHDYCKLGNNPHRASDVVLNCLQLHYVAILTFHKL